LPALQSLSPERTVEEAIAAMRERLGDFVGRLPERIELPVRLVPEERAVETVEVPLRDVVGKALDEEYAARLQRIADPLRQPLFRAVATVEAAREVTRYNLDAALDELAAPEPAPDDARELVQSGLARAAEQVRAVPAPLEAPWHTYVRDTVGTFERSWARLHQRLGAESLVEGQLLDLRTQLGAAVRRGTRGARALAERAVQASRVAFRLGRREAERLIRLGQTAAGLAEATERERLRTLDALAGSGTLTAGLPLVYRRLFSFEPLTDPSLLVGRDAELARLRTLYERWGEGRPASAIVVAGPSGSGRTSLLNVLRATAFGDAPVAHLHLTDRLDRPDALAALLADALDIPPEAGASLERLEDHLRAERTQRVCLIEGLEHLVLRAPNGLDDLERTLVFFSRTDCTVFWLATATDAMWRFAAKAAPQVTGLVDDLELSPLSRADLEEAILRRHRRSGLPLTFLPPDSPSPLLARRLKQARTDEDREALLRSEFFDGLHRVSGTHLPLALLYWLRAAEPATDEVAANGSGEGSPSPTTDAPPADRLLLHPVRPLDFSFLNRFDLPRAFALKALLQHGTLTLAEHDRVLRASRAESFLVFEALRNLHLIEPIQAPDRNGQAPTTVEAGVRYRLHPLAVAPVT
ncbi:MAG: AAA family ATPase, partial [Rhodothermales bacterium]|nr:AAA family ATPase [Rhodothermales bacterium]